MPSPSKVGAKKPRYLIEVERLRERLHGITLKHNDVVINNVAHRQKIKELENEVYDLKDEVIRLSERNVRLEAEVGRLRKLESRGKQERNDNLQGFLGKEEDAKILLHVLSTLIVSTPALTVLRDGILSNLTSSPSSGTSLLPNATTAPTPLSPHQPFAYWQPKLNPQGTVKASASPVGINNTLKEEDEPSEDFAQPRPMYKAPNVQTIESSSSTSSLSSIASSSSSSSLHNETCQPSNPPPTQSSVVARSQSRSSRAVRRSSGFLPPPVNSLNHPDTEPNLSSSTTVQSAPHLSSGNLDSRYSVERLSHRSRGNDMGDTPDEWETVEVKQEPLDEARFLTDPSEETVGRRVRVGEVELFDEISPEEDEGKKMETTTTGKAFSSSNPIEYIPKPNTSKPVASTIRKGLSSGSISDSRLTSPPLSQSTPAPNSNSTDNSRPKTSSTSTSLSGSSVLKTTKAPVLPSSSSNMPSAPTSSTSLSTSRSSVAKSKTSLVGSMKPPNPKAGFTPTSNSLSTSSSSSAHSAAPSAAEAGSTRSNGTFSTSQSGSKGGSSMVKMKDVADQLRKGVVGPVGVNPSAERSVLKAKPKVEEADIVIRGNVEDVGIEHEDEEDWEEEEDRMRRMRRRESPSIRAPESGQSTISSRAVLSTPPPEDVSPEMITPFVPSGSTNLSATSGSTEEIQSRRGRERKNVNYKEPSLMTKMRKPSDNTASKPKPRNTLPSSSRASSQEVEHDLLSSMDARNPALVVPRNDLVRRKSSLPKKLPVDNTSANGRIGSGSHPKMIYSDEEEEEEVDDGEEDEDDYEGLDEREHKSHGERRMELKKDTGRINAILTDYLQDGGGDSVDEEEDDYDAVVRRLKIVTPAPRASTSSSSSTVPRRRDSGLTANSRKARTRVLSEDEDDATSYHVSADPAPRASSTRRQSSRRTSIAG